MSDQLQFRISQYVYLARLCDETDPKKQEYMLKAEELLQEMEELIKQEEEERKMQNPVYKFIAQERNAKLVTAIGEILEKSSADDYEFMTVSLFMEYYPCLQIGSPEQVAKALNVLNIPPDRKVIDGTQQRVRYLPKPKNAQ